MTGGEDLAQQRAAAPGPVKVDPETLALRAQPPRAIRFKRGATVGIAAAVSVGLAATAWIALQPAGSPVSGDISDGSEIAATASVDALASLPKDYGEVPKLGPPLPGDLGGPILRKREMDAAAERGGTRDVAMSLAQERDRRTAERRAAMESPLMARSPSPATSVAVGGDTTEPPGPRQAGTRVLGSVTEPASTGTPAGAARIAANTRSIVKSPSPYTLSAGSVITASLITGVRSDLPGIVTAQISERVYDSATGTILLIPQGTRLVGKYSDAVAFGQRRALILWQRLVFPDGSSLTIEDVPATDASGFAGLADEVDFHSGALLRGVAVSTLLGVGSNLTFAGESEIVRALRESTQQNASRAGEQLVSKNLAIPPTITIRPGAPVRLVVHHDLILQPWPHRSLP